MSGDMVREGRSRPDRVLRSEPGDLSVVTGFMRLGGPGPFAGRFVRPFPLLLVRCRSVIAVTLVSARARGAGGGLDRAPLGGSSQDHQADGMKMVLITSPACAGSGTRLGLATGPCSSRYRMLLPSLEVGGFTTCTAHAFGSWKPVMPTHGTGRPWALRCQPA